jgi:hypothetical protein
LAENVCEDKHSSLLKQSVIDKEKKRFSTSTSGLKGGIVNRPAVFTVDTCGETGSLGFSIEGPSQAKINCKDNGDGSADVEYLPTAVGEYAVHILCDKEDIPGDQSYKHFFSSSVMLQTCKLRFVHTRDVDLAISLSDAILIEILPSFQIATAGNSNNV